MTRRAIVLGSGKRVLEAVLPVLAAAQDRFELKGVYARTRKKVESAGASHDVAPLDELTAEQLAATDLVVMAVAKGAVPAVLARLGELGASGVDLLIDTPVLRFKHTGHLGLLEAFRNVWVAEDCSTLPCFDPVHETLAAGELGALVRVVLDRSAYAYHGFATAKGVLGASFVRRASRKGPAGGQHRRSVIFQNGIELVVNAPRDYSVGRIRIECTTGVISDEPDPEPGVLRLEPVVDGDECLGFRVGARAMELDATERTLIGGARPGAEQPYGVFAWMEGMKRVGLLRLLRSIDEGRGAYPLEQALDDTVVDYHIEKFGAYFANPFTHPRFAPARFMMRALTKVAGK